MKDTLPKYITCDGSTEINALDLSCKGLQHLTDLPKPDKFFISKDDPLNTKLCLISSLFRGMIESLTCDILFYYRSHILRFLQKFKLTNFSPLWKTFYHSFVRDSVKIIRTNKNMTYKTTFCNKEKR